MIYLLIGYMWLFLHRPWEVWPWMATYRPERTFMILMIVCWLLSGPQLQRWNRLHTYFILFVLAMTASTLLSPYYPAGWEYTENYLKLLVFYVLLVTSVRCERDLRILVAGFVGAMTLFAAHSLREYYLGRVFMYQGLGRLRGVNSMFGDQNYFAGIVVITLPFVWVLWREWTGWLRRAALGCFALFFWCIILTGSRMGFVGLLVATILSAWSSSRRVFLVSLLPLFLFVAWSFLPDGQKTRYLTLAGIQTEATQAREIGSYRSEPFWLGWEAFQERPLLGFGPFGTRIVHFDGKKGLHNTYGELLGELGLAGGIPFVLILLAIGQNFVQARRMVQSTDLGDDLFSWYTVSATSAAYFLLAVMSWGLHFTYYHPWLWFAGFQVVAFDCLQQQAEAAQQHLDCGHVSSE